MNRNLMWMPTSVLNSKSAFNQKGIFVKWESVDPSTRERQIHSFEFSPMMNNPMPIPEHAKLFDILLTLYANNLLSIEHEGFKVGTLFFRMTDVAMIAGKKYTDGFRSSLAEAIYRYMRCIAFWKNAYLFNGMRGNLSCTPIEKSSLWDDDAGQSNYEERKRIKCASPRNSHNPSAWNMIKFNESLTEVLHNGDTRLFLSEIIKSDLRPVPYIIYRYFYAFSDIKYVERSLSQLCQNFGFSKRYNFPVWFRSQLDEIVHTNLIEDYEWPTDIKNWNEAIVRVKCKCFTKQVKLKSTTRNKLMDVDNLTNLGLLEFYIEAKSRSIIDKDTIDLLEFVEKSQGKDVFYQLLRRTLKNKATEFNRHID
jgi:hypothetical protein